MKLSTVCWNSFAVFLIKIHCKNVWDLLNDFLRAMIPWSSALEAKIQAGICRPRCFLDSLPWSFQICTPSNFPPDWCCWCGGDPPPSSRFHLRLHLLLLPPTFAASQRLCLESKLWAGSQSLAEWCNIPKVTSAMPSGRFNQKAYEKYLAIHSIKGRCTAHEV